MEWQVWQPTPYWRENSGNAWHGVMAASHTTVKTPNTKVAPLDGNRRKAALNEFIISPKLGQGIGCLAAEALKTIGVSFSFIC